jgi:hypothetical protein
MEEHWYFGENTGMFIQPMHSILVFRDFVPVFSHFYGDYSKSSRAHNSWVARNPRLAEVPLRLPSSGTSYISQNAFRSREKERSSPSLGDADSQPLNRLDEDHHANSQR